MPCNSEHMNQTGLEAAIQHAAQVFIGVLETQGLPVPQDVRDSDTYYAKDESIIPRLCAHLNALSPEKLDELLYSNARDKHRRYMADWWEKHQAADQRREREEQEDTEEKALRDSGKAKLSPEERRALGLD